MNVRVTVLMPVYNAAPFLREAIDSILNQTFSNFIFLIINDGSVDDSEAIILSYKDERIKYLKNETNKGLIYTLNKGLEIIDTEYLVRMDADDISFPERIEKQIDFMEKNKDIAVCGAQIQYFGNIEKTNKSPLDHEMLHANLMFSHKINHPTAIMRVSVFKSNNLKYDPNYKLIEDYDLWLRLSKFGKLANLPDVLLKYRWEGQNSTFINWSTSEERYKSIYKRIFRELNIEESEEKLRMHLELAIKTAHIGKIKRLKVHSDLLVVQNKIYNIYSEKAIHSILKNFWDILFFKVVENGFVETVRYWIYTKSVTLVQIRYLFGFYKKKIKL